MSRVGKKPIQLQAGAQASLADGKIKVKGPKGELELALTDAVEVNIAGTTVNVKPLRENTAFGRAIWGTTRANIAAMAKGVTEGFTKTLEMVGVGYRAALKGNDLQLQIGLSHDVLVQMPKGIKVEVPKPTEIRISGSDKQLVGQMAAVIRGYKPPEPFLGKGIKLAGERIRRKEGKKK